MTASSTIIAGEPRAGGRRVDDRDGHELILYRLDELKGSILETKQEQSRDNANIFKRLGEVEISISALRVKSGVWGIVGGAVPMLIMLILYVVFK